MIPPKPFTGSKPWALILCKFSDHPEEPQPPQFFRDFVTRGNGGINDYFNDVSYGNINMDGSDVFGWFDLPYTRDTDAARGRWDRVMSAINAVANRVDFRPFSGIAVMLNAQVDSGGFQGPATLTLNGSTQKATRIGSKWSWSSPALSTRPHGPSSIDSRVERLTF